MEHTIEIIPAKSWESGVNVDGVRVPICGGQFVSCNILEVEVGTNGFCGGDSGHGSRTYLSLTNAASTDMCVIIDGEMYEPKSVELMFGGDCELRTVIQSLEFALSTLKAQANVKTANDAKE